MLQLQVTRWMRSCTAGCNCKLRQSIKGFFILNGLIPWCEWIGRKEFPKQNHDFEIVLNPEPYILNLERLDWASPICRYCHFEDRQSRGVNILLKFLDLGLVTDQLENHLFRHPNTISKSMIMLWDFLSPFPGREWCEGEDAALPAGDAGRSWGKAQPPQWDWYGISVSIGSVCIAKRFIRRPSWFQTVLVEICCLIFRAMFDQMAVSFFKNPLSYASWTHFDARNLNPLERELESS